MDTTTTPAVVEEEVEEQLPEVHLEAHEAPDVIRRFIVEEKARQAFAVKSRAHMHAQLNRGEQATGHRIDWVMAASDACVEVLLECAQRFNQLYPYDTAILGDFLDVLATAKGKFVKSAGG